MFVDTMWSSVYDNNLEIRVSGRNSDDHKHAESMLNYTQWGFSISNSRKHLMQSLKEAMILGNGYGKIGFVDTTTEIEYKKGTTKVKKELKEQYPYIKYVSSFNLFHDPTVEYMEDSRYIIERKIMHEKDMLEQYNVFVPNLKNQLDNRTTSPYYFFQYDFNRVKYLAFWNQEPIAQYINGTTLQNDYSIYWKNYLNIDYKKEYHEVIEYWEDKTFILIVDGKVFYDGANPLPMKKKPYFELHYNKIPGIPFGQWMGTSLEDIQEQADTIFNLTMDNIKLQVAPMFQKMKGGDIFQFGEGKLQYEPFGVVEVNSPDAISRLELGTNDFAGTNMIQYLTQLGEMSEGVNSYSVGYQNKVERSATGVSALVQSFKSRLLPLTESLNMALAKVAEMWAIIGVAILPETIQVKVQPEGGAVRFADITMEDIIGKFDFEFDAQALKTATREGRRDQALQLLDIATKSGSDPATWQFFVNMENIWKFALDSFEMPSEDYLLTDKDIIKKQYDIEKIKQSYQAKGMSPQADPNVAQNGAIPIPDAAGGALPPGIMNDITAPANIPAPAAPESSTLSDAMMS